MKNIQRYLRSVCALGLLVLPGLLSLNSCEKEGKEECRLVCTNNGTLQQDCSCDCPAGTTGANCGTLVRPAGVRISKAAIREFPASKLGFLPGTTVFGVQPWDTGASPVNRPDSYIEISSGNTVLGVSKVNNQTATFNPGTPGFLLEFGHSVTLTPITSPYTITLYDDDQPANPEIMAVISLPFTDHTGSYPYPAVISVTGTYGGAIGSAVLDVYVEWIY